MFSKATESNPLNIGKYLSKESERSSTSTPFMHQRHKAAYEQLKILECTIGKEQGR